MIVMTSLSEKRVDFSNFWPYHVIELSVFAISEMINEKIKR